MDEKRRIFVGIPAGEEIKAKASEFRRQYQALPARWIEPRNLHITLVPPWQADAPEIAGIVRDLKAPCHGGKSFLVKLETIEAGPGPKEPRLVWARGRVPAQIEDLRLRIYQALNQKPEARPFRLHLTLARIALPYFSSPLGEMSRPLMQRAGQRGWEIDWVMEVNRFVLYESHLSPRGAEYEIIEEFRLCPLDKPGAGM